MNLELRKAALEATGFALLHDWDCPQIDGAESCSCMAIESDPQYSEPWFLAWCEKNGYSFYLYGPIRHPQKLHLAGLYGCEVATWNGNFYNPKWEAYGTTPSEARAKAVIEASKVKPETEGG